LISTMSDVVPQRAIVAQHDEKLGTTNFRMLVRQVGYHGTTTLKFVGVRRGTLKCFRHGTPKCFRRGTLKCFRRGTPKCFRCGTPKCFRHGTPKCFRRGTLKCFLTWLTKVLQT
jgi:hypothetical protein